MTATESKRPYYILFEDSVPSCLMSLDEALARIRAILMEESIDRGIFSFQVMRYDATEAEARE